MLNSRPISRWISDHMGGKSRQAELQAPRETPALEGGRLNQLKDANSELSSSLPSIPLAVEASSGALAATGNKLTRQSSDPDRLSKSPTQKFHNFSSTLFGSTSVSHQESPLMRPRASTGDFMGSSAAAKWMMKKKQLAAENQVTSPLTKDSSPTTERPPKITRGSSVDDSAVNATRSWWNMPLFGQNQKKKDAAVTYSKDLVMNEPDFAWPVADDVVT